MTSCIKTREAAEICHKEPAMDAFTFCPVCRQGQCGHLLDRRVDPAADFRRDTFNQLRAHASTPLDLGVARFASDVVALLSVTK